MEGESDPAPSASDECLNNSVLTRGSAALTSETPLDETKTQGILSVTSGRENAGEEIDLQEPDSQKSDRNQDSELKEDLNSLALLEARSEQLDSQIETAKNEEDSQTSSQLEQEVSTVAQSFENIKEDTTQSRLRPSGIQSDVTSNNDSESNENEDQEKRSFDNECESVDSVSVGDACAPTVLDSGSESAGNGALQTTSSVDAETAEEEVNGAPTTIAVTSETTETGEQIQGITRERPVESLYHIKWIKWKGVNTPIVTQNENGPCPLLAIVNVLLLQRRINIPPLQEIVTAGQLMEYIGDCILEEAPKRLSEGAQLNYEQNMHDAIAIMNKLQTGLDVNVKFTGVSDFEFTRECIVFDLLSIGLYHGWLIDPQNTHIVSAVGLLSYNQLVEKIIASKQAGISSQLVSEGLIGESYLEQTASQLTYHGLCELNSCLQADQLCVFFRNNHFSTLYKHKDELFLLVTDQGFLTEDCVVWESLSNVEGDSYFVNAEFRSLPTMTTSPPLNHGISQEDQDYLVALSLHNEQEQAARMAPTEGLPAASANPHPPLSQEFSSIQQIQTNQEWSDLQLAMQLQQEEQQQQPQVQQQQRINPQPQQNRPPVSRPVVPPPTNFRSPANQRPESNEKCVIL